MLINKKQRYKLGSLLKILPFVASMSVFIVTNLIDIIETYIPLGAEGELNLKISLISLLDSILFFSMIFNDERVGSRTKLIARSAQTISIVTITIALVEVIFEPQIFLKIIEVDNNWIIEFEPLLFTLLIVQTFLGLFAMFSAIQFQGRLEFELLKEQHLRQYLISGILFAIGGLLFISEIALRNTVAREVITVIDLAATLSLIIGIWMLFASLLNSPFSIIFMKSKMNILIQQNIVGWALFTNEDTGPALRNEHSNILEKHKITHSELLKFGMQGIILSYSDNKFATGVSISPFAGTNDLISISLSFIHSNPDLTDERLQNKAFSLFTLLIPTVIISIFSKPLARLENLSRIVKNRVDNTKDISEFSRTDHLNDLAYQLLDVIF